ncbi:MAG: hypothetical protein IKH57_09065, partial [Clostridia bacterium]|nr:hypothetical protein [Clostridia bacterium]
MQMIQSVCYSRGLNWWSNKKVVIDFSLPRAYNSKERGTGKTFAHEDGKRRRAIGWKRARVRREQCPREPQGGSKTV